MIIDKLLTKIFKKLAILKNYDEVHKQETILIHKN
jgi:hypothetical protein